MKYSPTSKRFKLLVEKKFDCAIKKLKNDSGGEYTSSEFAEFCENEGIRHEVIVAYTPLHNDIAERKN